MSEKKSQITFSKDDPPTKKRRGRPPRYAERRKLKAFHLPLPMIAEIERESKRLCGGNSTALAVDIFELYFAARARGEDPVYEKRGAEEDES